MTKQAKQTLGSIIVIATIVLLLSMVVLAGEYGAWVWIVPPLLIAIIVGLSFRYSGFRSVVVAATTGALDAIGQWWTSSSRSNRSKERVHIPADIRRFVTERSNGVCEHPDCARKTRNHFHHVDEDPSRNIRTNIVYICPNHHDDAHRGLITREEQKRWARRRPKKREIREEGASSRT